MCLRVIACTGCVLSTGGIGHACLYEQVCVVCVRVVRSVIEMCAVVELMFGIGIGVWGRFGVGWGCPCS